MKKYALITLLIFSLCSCGLLGLQQDPGMKGLLYAKDEIASLAEQYEIAYQNASLTAQLNWQEEIDPLFIQADEILTQWEYFLKIGKDTSTVQETYVLIRNAILKTLVEIKEG